MQLGVLEATLGAEGCAALDAGPDARIEALRAAFVGGVLGLADQAIFAVELPSHLAHGDVTTNRYPYGRG